MVLWYICRQFGQNHSNFSKSTQLQFYNSMNIHPHLLNYHHRIVLFHSKFHLHIFQNKDYFLLGIASQVYLHIFSRLIGNTHNLSHKISNLQGLAPCNLSNWGCMNHITEQLESKTILKNILLQNNHQNQEAENHYSKINNSLLLLHCMFCKKNDTGHTHIQIHHKMYVKDRNLDSPFKG